MGDRHINPRGGLQRFEENGAAHATGAAIYTPDDVRVADDVGVAYQASIAAGHYWTLTRTENGQVVVALIADPRSGPGLSSLTYKWGAKAPMAVEFEAAFSGRARQWFAGALLGAFDAAPESPLPALNVVSWWQHNLDGVGAYSGVAGTFLQLKLAAPLPAAVHLGDWVCISGAAATGGIPADDQALVNAAIRYIDFDRKTMVLGYADETPLLVSAAVAEQTPPDGTMQVNIFRNLLGAPQGVGIRYGGPTATANAILTKMAGDVQISGALLGDQRATTGTSSPQTVVGALGSLELKATTRVRIEHRVDETAVADVAVDSGGVFTARAIRTTVKPQASMALKPRFYLNLPISLSQPVGRIAVVEKTGSAVATVTTKEPHGLVTGAKVTLKGVMDAVNFASGTAPTAVTVIDPTHFSVALGSAATALSWGGSVHRCYGGFDQPGVQSATVAGSATYDATLDQVRLSGSAAWTVTAGDTVLVVGAVGNGIDPGLDGLWRVAHLSNTNLYLDPIVDGAGVRVSPSPTAGLHAVGGTVVVAPSLRLHDLAVEEWSEHRVMLDGAGCNRLDKALPVNVLGTVAINSAIQSDLTGGVNVRPAVGAATDITAAALTASNASGALTNTFGNGFVIQVAVTAVAGTAPTLDIRIEETLDGGVNWLPLYDFARITAVGAYATPILRATGRSIRYIRTVGGAGASFTMSAIRTTLPQNPDGPQKRLMDRTISLTTLGSTTPPLFVGGLAHAQMVLNAGAITTTAPVLQLEGSEDGSGWYPLGATLAAVAASTVETTVSGKSPTYVRGRVVTAGVGVTPGFVALKAWS